MAFRYSATMVLIAGFCVVAPSLASTSILPARDEGREAAQRGERGSPQRLRPAKGHRRVRARKVARLSRAVSLGRRTASTDQADTAGTASRREPAGSSRTKVFPAVEVREPQPVWSDEFSGAAGDPPDPGRWANATGGDGWGNEELEYYTDSRSNSALDGEGNLVITARRETITDKWEGVTRQFTSARLETRDRYETTYGRIEARIKLPEGRGLWPAFWAVGSDQPVVDWPECGEIDMMEYLGHDPYTLYGSIHGPVGGSSAGYGLTTPKKTDVSLADGFHRYGVNWKPNRIEFTFDGEVYSTRTRAELPKSRRWVFDKPFFLRLNLAVGGSWPGSPDASTRFPGEMLVDWVRVWS